MNDEFSEMKDKSDKKENNKSVYNLTGMTRNTFNRLKKYVDEELLK